LGVVAPAFLGLMTTFLPHAIAHHAPYIRVSRLHHANET
jgi:hypothetical protein